MLTSQHAKAARRPDRAAFTLIELLVVVAIVALLVALVVPCLSRAKATTLRVMCATNLRQINLVMHMYTSENDDAYPCAEDPVATGYWLWMGRGWRSHMEPYLNAKLSEDKPSVLFCKADPDKKNYEATSYAYSMAFYHSPEQIDQITTTRELWDANLVRPSMVQRINDVTHPSNKILIGEWSNNHCNEAVSAGWWSWEGQRNFLLADGQVRYIRAEDIYEAGDGFPDPNLTPGGVTGKDIN